MKMFTLIVALATTGCYGTSPTPVAETDRTSLIRVATTPDNNLYRYEDAARGEVCYFTYRGGVSCWRGSL